MQNCHDHLDDSGEKAQQNSIISVSSLNLLVCHQGHESSWTYSYVLYTAKYRVHKAPSKRRVEAILKQYFFQSSDQLKILLDPKKIKTENWMRTFSPRMKPKYFICDKYALLRYVSLVLVYQESSSSFCLQFQFTKITNLRFKSSQCGVRQGLWHNS